MQVELNLTKQEETQLLQNSIERVINTSLQLATRAEKFALEHWSELGSTNRQDWEELKELTCKLWNEARNAVYKKQNEEIKNAQWHRSMDLLQEFAKRTGAELGDSVLDHMEKWLKTHPEQITP